MIKNTKIFLLNNRKDFIYLFIKVKFYKIFLKILTKIIKIYLIIMKPI